MHYFYRNLSPSQKLNLIHTIKVMIAVLISFCVVQIDPEPHAVWVIISTIVIMMAHASTGVQVTKALSRAFGTCLGATMGVFVLLLHINIYIDVLLILFTTAVFSYARIQKWLSEYAVILGLITFIMITIHPSNPWQLGVERAIEILLGIAISLLVSYSIFPISSSQMLTLYIQKNWNQLRTYTHSILLMKHTRHHNQDINQLENKILTRHNTITQLLNLSVNKKSKTDYTILRLTARHQLAIWRYITVLDIALQQLDTQYITNKKALLPLIQRTCKSLIDCFPKTTPAIKSAAQLSTFNATLELLHKAISAKYKQDYKTPESLATMLFIFHRIAIVFQNEFRPNKQHKKNNDHD